MARRYSEGAAKFVEKEMSHLKRRGKTKHVKTKKQAVAVGLSKARAAGERVPTR